MAKKTKPAAVAAGEVHSPMPKKIEMTPETMAQVDPSGVYEIKMARSVKHGATWLRPNAARIRVLGATLIKLGDAVRQYERFE